MQINTENLKCGDIIFVSISPEEQNILAKGRFVSFTNNGNVKMYIIDPNYKLVDIEISKNRIIKTAKPD